jgi:diguanylate cyclase (GGDEF)-like protein
VTFTDIDRRLLEAYARHAGAVLEHAVALHQARGDRDTAAAVTAQNAQLVEQASHQAMHDPLTGLANRRLAREHGQKGIQAARRDGRAMAICVANLDRFKNVNDTLGHAAGDELLRSVALRIENAVRDGDVLARIGGDEFVILLPGVGGNVDARSTADRIIANLAEPFTVGGHELYVSASVGIACYPQHGLDFDTLLRHAGAATYAVKATGRDAIAVYADSAATDRAELLQIETELHRAISGGELQVYYQPQLDLRDGRMVAVEALVRWQHPRRGLLAPASFLALAEESGLIAEIDAFVRRTAFGQIRSWLDRGHELYVAVNMSTRDLSDPGLLATLVDETSAAGLDPTHVELEITERVAIDNVHLKPVLAELSRAGFRLAIDDFGTGNSVLGRLNGTQVDTLKIDQSFVRDIVDEASATPVVQAITSLARNLRIDTVAEGVEESHQVPVLLRCGARIGQGYLFCRPVPADEVGRLLAYPPIAPGAQRLVAMS